MLKVDSKQAEALQLAREHGNLSLTVRNPLDKTLTTSDGLYLSDLAEELGRNLARLNVVELSEIAMTIESAPSDLPCRCSVAEQLFREVGF